MIREGTGDHFLRCLWKPRMSTWKYCMGKLLGAAAVSYVAQQDPALLTVVDAVTETKQKPWPHSQGWCQISYIGNVHTRPNKHIILRTSSYETSGEQLQSHLPSLVTKKYKQTPYFWDSKDVELVRNYNFRMKYRGRERQTLFPPLYLPLLPSFCSYTPHQK